MKKFIITLLGILILAAGTIEASVPGPGHPAHPGRVNHARHQVHQDKARIRNNVKNGHPKAAKKNAKKLKHDRKKLHRARKQTGK
jgi:hypothetical protein